MIYGINEFMNVEKNEKLCFFMSWALKAISNSLVLLSTYYNKQFFLLILQQTLNHIEELRFVTCVILQTL